MQQEQKHEPRVTVEAPRPDCEETPRLRVEELEARIAPNAVWSD